MSVSSCDAGLFLSGIASTLNLFAAFSQAYLWNRNVNLRQLLLVRKLWQHGHPQKNDTNVTGQGHHTQVTLEIKVIRTWTITGWCLSVQNRKLHEWVYLILIGIGQFKDTNKSHENALKTPCDSHYLAYWWGGTVSLLYKDLFFPPHHLEVNFFLFK